MNIAPPPHVMEPDLWSEPLKTSGDNFNDAYALTLVKQTFTKFEQWRQSNHDQRWRISDMLFFGSVPRRNWPGTSVPRAALGFPIAFEQVDTAVAIIMQQLFGVGKEWFSVGADPGARVEDARAIEQHFRYLFRHGKNVYGHSVEIEFEQLVQSVCQYGNGACKVTWDSLMRRPQLEYVDLRDLYIDPRTPNANLNEARAVIEVKRMTVDDLDAMRSDPRMKIPPRDILVGMGQMASHNAGDTAVQSQEAYRKIDYRPGSSDQIPNPADGLIEVLIYTSKNRIIWVLNKVWTAYNEKNPYAVINYFMAPCYLVLARALAMSVAEVNEGNQMYMQGLMSGHLDEVNLSLFPPRYRKRGQPMTPSQKAWGPGSVNEFANPKEDVVAHQPVGALSNIQQTLAYLDSSADKRTGINSTLAGAPKGSNLFRTTAGVEVASRPLRLSRIMKHIEMYVLCPALYFFYLMIRYHREPGEQIFGIDPDGGFTDISTTSFQAPVHFSMHAASDMLTREQLAGQIPVIAQTLFSPQAQEAMNRIGKTGDYGEFLEMVQDATGVRQKYKLVRNMNEQEVAAMNQPDPQTQAKIQADQRDAQLRMELAALKAEVDKYKVMMEHDADTQETEEKSARELVKVVMEAMQSGNGQAEAQAKLQAIIAQGQQKLQHADQMHKMKMGQRQEEVAQKAQLNQAAGEMDLMAKTRQMTADAAMQQFKHQTGMKMAEEKAKHQAKLLKIAPKRDAAKRKPTK